MVGMSGGVGESVEAVVDVSTADAIFWPRMSAQRRQIGAAILSGRQWQLWWRRRAYRCRMGWKRGQSSQSVRHTVDRSRGPRTKDNQ